MRQREKVSRLPAVALRSQIKFGPGDKHYHSRVPAIFLSLLFLSAHILGLIAIAPQLYRKNGLRSIFLLFISQDLVCTASFRRSVAIFSDSKPSLKLSANYCAYPSR